MILFFQGDKFPDAIRYMTGLQWLRLDKTNLDDIPEELGKLMKLVNFKFYLFFVYLKIIYHIPHNKYILYLIILGKFIFKEK